MDTHLSRVSPDSDGLEASIIDALKSVAWHPDYSTWESRAIASIELTKLPQNFDEEGGKPATAIARSAAIKTMVSFANFAHRAQEASIPCADICLGPDGGIDLDWQSDDRTLLVHINSDGTMVGFYGDRPKGTEVAKGKVALADINNQTFESWLVVLQGTVRAQD